ncbi:MAG TPA: MBL fold metallo-hydrolase, partial [Aggregatilineales bacterium]|nr:MBL fold metallo-hydrolase [Aggregatilineales bacterium]
MPVQILQLPLGMLQTNCYIAADSDTNDAVIIDPSAEADVILREVQERGYIVREILATHTHFDHVIAAAAVIEATGAPFRMHRDGLEQLRTLDSRAAFFGIQVDASPPEPDSFIEHGDTVEVASIRLEARFTPGHSPGHLTFVFHEGRIAFVGDCVFMG